MILQNIDYGYIRKNLLAFVRDKDFRFMSLHRMGAFDDMPDEKYLKKLWRAVMGYPLDIENPVTFNEKIQWLKLYDRNPLYHTLVDKIEVKKWVAERIGEEFIIPTLGVWDDPDDIDFDSLPDKFVLKCNHNSGKGMCICKDKSKLDISKVREELREGLKQNYYLPYREWAYKDVKPRILAEKYITEDTELDDYKIFCTDGKPQLVEVDFDRFKEHKRNLYTTDWDFIEAEICYKSNKEHIINKPKCLKKLLDVAGILANNIPIIRTDFYVINDSVLFGELTFYPDAGFSNIKPVELAEKLGGVLEYHSLQSGHLYEMNDAMIYVRADKEKIIDDGMTDYKLMCFNGEVKCIFTCTERFSDDGLKVTFFDADWNKFDFERTYPSSKKPIRRPASLDEMIYLSEKLSKTIPFVRVDFYEHKRRPLFGELTLYPGTGLEKFSDQSYDRMLGSWLKL